MPLSDPNKAEPVYTNVDLKLVDATLGGCDLQLLFTNGEYNADAANNYFQSQTKREMSAEEAAYAKDKAIERHFNELKQKSQAAAPATHYVAFPTGASTVSAARVAARARIADQNNPRKKRLKELTEEADRCAALDRPDVEEKLRQSNEKPFLIRKKTNDNSQLILSIKINIDGKQTFGHYPLAVQNDGSLIAELQGRDADHPHMEQADNQDALVDQIIRFETARLAKTQAVTPQQFVVRPLHATQTSTTTTVTATLARTPEQQHCDDLLKNLDAYISRIESHKKGSQIDFAYGFVFFKSWRALNRQKNYEMAKTLKSQIVAEMKQKQPAIGSVISETNIKKLRTDVRYQLSSTGMFKTSTLHGILEAARHPEKKSNIKWKI